MNETSESSNDWPRELPFHVKNSPYAGQILWGGRVRCCLRLPSAKCDRICTKRTFRDLHQFNAPALRHILKPFEPHQPLTTDLCQRHDRDVVTNREFGDLLLPNFLIEGVTVGLRRTNNLET